MNSEHKGFEIHQTSFQWLRRTAMAEHATVSIYEPIESRLSLCFLWASCDREGLQLLTKPKGVLRFVLPRVAQVISLLWRHRICISRFQTFITRKCETQITKHWNIPLFTPYVLDFQIKKISFICTLTLNEMQLSLKLKFRTWHSNNKVFKSKWLIFWQIQQDFGFSCFVLQQVF